jgi:NitT/TauT family transport system ATP-binding protein
MRIELRNVGVRFHSGVQAAQSVDLTVEPGEFVAIVGPSGCGKSTVLNAIASLIPESEAVVEGDIAFDGVDRRKRSTRELNFGYVFQRDCLLPWRTIAQNVATGLEIRGVSAAKQKERIDELLTMTGLTDFADHFPYQISGGMRQRVALIRTLAYSPDVVLMDEPFGALDAHTRMVLHAELIRIWERTHNTIIFVTHDLAEAITLAQRVIVFSRRPGCIRAEHRIDIPYPRDPFQVRGTEQFGLLEARIWQTLRSEFDTTLGKGRAA